MGARVGFEYKVRAFVRRKFPLFVRVRRVFRNLLRGDLSGGFGTELLHSIQGKLFYSQLGEDKEIYEVFFKDKQMRKGFFVELGAADGMTFSNTRFFEDYLGWQGLLIEPVPEQFEQLQYNRPKNILVNAAVNEKEEYVEFLGDGLTAGMVSTMDNNFKEEYHAGDTNSYLVPGLPFSKILSQNGVRSIELLSIDTEGAELAVLKTFDWTISAKIILIELAGLNLPKDNECRSLLSDHGYQFFKRMEISEIWYNPDFYPEFRRLNE